MQEASVAISVSATSLRAPASSTLSPADRLAYIASYWPCAPHWKGPDGVWHQQRLPLAWVSTSPAARIVAEQRHAWLVLPFTHIEVSPSDVAADCVSRNRVDNTFAMALMNATVHPRVIRTALETSTVRKENGSALSWLRWAVERLADVGHAASLGKRVSVAENIPASYPSTPPKKAKGSSSTARGTTDVADAARSCGVHLAGLTVVLVSGVHELNASGANTECPKDLRSGGKEAKGADVVPTYRRNDATTPGPQLLFPSTTSCGGSVASTLSVPPNAAMYKGMSEFLEEESMSFPRTRIFRAGAQLHGDDGGAEDETAYDPKTATSVYVVEQLVGLRQQTHEAKRPCVSSAAMSSEKVFSIVWFRQVFVSRAEATGDVLCGVSQWWLKRSIRGHELTTAELKTLHAKRCTCRTGTKGSWENPPSLPPPSLHIKYTADVFTDSWWPRSLKTAAQNLLVEQTSPISWAIRSLLHVWMMLVTFVEMFLHGALKKTPRSESSGVRHCDTMHRHSVPQVDFVSVFYNMGKIYGRYQLAALDVSHTGVRGVHLFAYAVGSVTAPITAGEDDASVVQYQGLRALDIAGCTRLHHRRGELDTLPHILNLLYKHVAREVAELVPSQPPKTLAVADLLLCFCWQDNLSLSRQSATGLALAFLTHHGHLTWLCGAGSDMDNAALRDLGQYALLVGAVVATQQPQTQDAPTCSLRALDLTSALSVDDVNPLGYLTELEQLLLPFTSVGDLGMSHLDGHTYTHDLNSILSLYSTAESNEAANPLHDVKKALQSTVAALKHITPIPGNNTAEADDKSRNPRSDVAKALQQKFCSHLYHLDLTYCLGVSSLKGLARQQRLELLNISQTRVNKIGLFGGVGDPHCTPPLRLFIAEMCEYISDLSGLAHMDTLECVVVRSGSLGDHGLRSMCTPNLRRLQLLDLSYCDRLHHVGCLAQLPALETLILDSTDITPSEVKQLRSSQSLHTLSLRFCTDFAFIGDSLRELEAVVGTFAALKRYMYEDLAGDEKIREKKK